MDKGDDKLSIKDHVYNRVIEFMKDNRITCEDTIYQTDRVITNAYEFIEDLFRMVGDELPNETSTLD